MTALNQLDLVREAQQSIPVNLEALARNLGLRVAYEPLDPEVSGYIHRSGDAWEIVVNSRHAPTRQRFTLAHEIGHYIYHRDRLGDGTNDTRAYRADESVAYYNSAIAREHEREANRFAAGLLMPAARVAHVSRTTKLNDPASLAPLFGVSPTAMEIRLNALAERGKL